MIFTNGDMGTNTLFGMFANSDKNKIDFCCVDVEYTEKVYQVYKHFFETNYEPEFISYEDFNISKINCLEKSVQGQTDACRHDYTQYLKPYKKEEKYITGSFINWDDWQERNPWIKTVNENTKDESAIIRKGEVQSRAFNTTTLELLLELLEAHPDFINLGDSRVSNDKTAAELIQSYEFLRHSRLYVGMCGSYDRWARLHSVPFVNMMEYTNIRMKSLHKLFFLPEHYG